MVSPFNTHGSLSWHELTCTNPAEAIRFYSKVFGWNFSTLELPHGHYYLIENEGVNIGGITESLTPEMPSTWTGYITVNDVDEVAINAKSLGGEIIYGPEDIPKIGRFCWIKDPTGAVIAAISYSTVAMADDS
ncbi:VOC family protein [Shewanella avicenniae]|uniref:VOC family protein n=1 Tax=Shewanella avicenniae TaxID=2814294 RepID=A0ABX7QUF8_9GAMM|nr:VOC family protein [Shewanella avicenniae]QSX35079.1 VOC family protein [Shewanella avicenniae]